MSLILYQKYISSSTASEIVFTLGTRDKIKHIGIQIPFNENDTKAEFDAQIILGGVKKIPVVLSPNNILELSNLSLTANSIGGDSSFKIQFKEKPPLGSIIEVLKES